MSHIPSGVTHHMGKLESFLAPLFQKAPHLSEGARNTLANIAPWLALVFGILGIVAVVSAGGVGMLFSFWMYFGGSSLPFLLALVIGFISAVLDLLAFKPLRAMHKSGWNLIFYGAVLSMVSTLIHMAVGYGSLMGLFMSVVGLWLLFEIRGLYR